MDNGYNFLSIVRLGHCLFMKNCGTWQAFTIQNMVFHQEYLKGGKSNYGHARDESIINIQSSIHMSNNLLHQSQTRLSLTCFKNNILSQKREKEILNRLFVKQTFAKGGGQDRDQIGKLPTDMYRTYMLHVLEILARSEL